MAQSSFLFLILQALLLDALPQNSCIMNNGGCQHSCVMEKQTPRCLCREGYVLDKDGMRCIERSGITERYKRSEITDSCSVNNGGCEFFCFMKSDKVVCLCPDSYHQSSDGKNCVSKAKITCQVPNVPNGEYGRNDSLKFQKVHETEVKVNEILILRCHKGYAPFPSTEYYSNDGFYEEEMRCNEGTWSKDLSCHLINCQVPDIQNGEFIRYESTDNFEQVDVTEEIENNEALTLRCHKGYVPFPTSENYSNDGFFEEEITCNFGTWSKNVSCLLHACKVPDILNGVFIRYTSDVNFEQVTKRDVIENKEVLTLRCHKGYAPFPRQINDSREGLFEEDIICDDGVWSKDLSCRLSSCSYVPRIGPNYPAIDNARPRKNHGYTITYTFRDGSTTVERGNVVCHFGEWIGVPSQSTNENITCSEFETPPELQVSYSEGDSVGSIANFTCTPPKILDGNSNAVCMDDGFWSHPLPTCIEVGTCSDLRTSAGLEVSYSNGVSAGSHATFSCSPPEILDGNSNAVCLDNGSWSHPLPTCRELSNCSKLGISGGLLVSYSNGVSFRSNATFSCSPPKHLNGHSSAVCLADGSWSHPLPKCTESIVCPEVTSTSVLQATYPEGRLPHDIVFFSCSPPTRMRGNSFAVCTPKGTWSDSPPLCIGPVTCSLFDASPELQVSYSTGNSVGSKASFSCSPPNTLVGHSNAVCLDNGSWSHPLPICKEPVTCPEFETSLELQVSYSDGVSLGSKANFSCPPSKVVDGDSSAECLDDGSWSHPLPTCKEPDICPKLQEHDGLQVQYSKGLLLGSKAIFSCSPPKRLVGNSKTVCRANGLWSHSSPICKDPVICSNLQTFAGLKVSYSNGVFVGSKATFSCSPPKILDGNPNAVCLNDRSWSHPVPTCKVPTCPEFDPFEELSVSYTNGNLAGSRASFSCIGHELLGNPFAICQNNSVWSHPLPSCEGVARCYLKKPETSTLMMHPERRYFKFGEKVRVWCPKGQKLYPDVQILMCLDREWANDLPDCI